jgi:hypothetical protein
MLRGMLRDILSMKLLRPQLERLNLYWEITEMRRSFLALMDSLDEEEITRAANIIDSYNHNPHKTQITDGLSQSLWSIVATLRHAREEAGIGENE